MSLTAAILAQAHVLGFDRAAVLPLGLPARYGAFCEWLAAGYAGEMRYLAERAAERAAPANLAPGAASMIVLAASYDPGALPPGWIAPTHGRLARYAWGPDYHEAIKARLFALDAFIRGQTGRAELGRACVDTAPLLERDFAAQAGLGFVGRNTCLITPGLGSWTFLAALLVPEQLLPDRRPMIEDGRSALSSVVGRRSPADCGRCTRCLDACPTGALVAPGILDARRCIAYLTIELRGAIPNELRPLLGNWVFGCDICQEVCPYNRPSRAAAGAAGAAPGDAAPPLAELLALDDAAFRNRYRGTAMTRAKRRGLVRNACVAAGNSGDRSLVAALAHLLTGPRADPDGLLRGHAAWAAGQLGGAEAWAALQAAQRTETDSWVISEIELALRRWTA